MIDRHKHICIHVRYIVQGSGVIIGRAYEGDIRTNHVRRKSRGYVEI